MNKWSEARYEFLSSKQYDSALPGLEQNLQIAEDKLEVGRLEKPLGTIDYLVKAGFVVQQGILTSLSLAILLVGLVMLRKSATLPRVLAWVGLVAFPVAFSWWIGSWPVALTREATYLSEGPSGLFASNNEIPAGIMVIAIGEGDWKKIIYPSRFSGWILGKSLRRL